MSGFRKVEIPREQFVLWSQTLDDAISLQHPVRLFDQLLGSDAMQSVWHDWRQDYVLVEGRPGYDPRDLAGLYLYGMLNRLRSSRQLEGACHNRLDVIWLMNGQKPDHSTIAGFVARHGGHLKNLFRRTIGIALDAGLVKLEHTSVDGTKLEADAGRNSVRSETTLEAQLAELDASAAALEKEWAQNEARESTLWVEQTPPSDTLSPDQRLAQFRRKQQKLKSALDGITRREQGAAQEKATQAEQEKEEPGGTEPGGTKSGGAKPRAIASTTDPDARIMPDKQGKSRPGYNAQLAVDAHAGIIVAAAINDRPEDQGQLTPMLELVKENCGTLPAEVSADSGYNTGPELAKLEDQRVIGYLPDAGTSSAASRPGERLSEAKRQQATAAAHAGQTLSEPQWEALPRTAGKIDKSAFTYEARSDAYRCPAGVMLPVLRHSADHKSGGVVHRIQYGGSPACAACAHAAACCKNPENGRTVNRDQYEPLRERMRERMQSEAGRARYRLRGQTVEPRFGVMKSALGIRRLLHRGMEAVRVEFASVCAALNIGVLLREWSATVTTLEKG